MSASDERVHQKPPPPQPSPTPVKRDRLFALIDGARAGSGLWVSGMAGAGKTTLVASYLQEHRCPFLWYALDRRDGDLPNFFFRFGSELRRISHRAYRGMPLLTPEYLPGTESFVSGYFAKLFSRIATPLWMVFDNYQDVPPQSGFNLVLMALMKFAPPGVVVVVISRDDPPPIMAGMLAARKLTLIDSDRLAFTRTEAKELVRQLGRPSMGEDQVRRIWDLTRGWVSGIILLMLKPDPIDRLEPPDGSRVREVFDYLGNEVFERIGEDEREFLLKTALLPDLAPDIAASLAGTSHPDEVLSGLIRRNFFIERALEPGAAYRYHPLFRSFLLERFAKRYRGPEGCRLRTTAGDLLAGAGRGDDAAGLYADAGEWGRLSELIHERAPQLIRQGRVGTVLGWIDLLPGQMVAEDPWLLLWKGICTVPVDPEAGWRLCCSAHPKFAGRGDAGGCRAALSFILQTAVWSGKPWPDIAPWVDEAAKYVDTEERADPCPYGNLVSGMLAALSLFAPEDPRLSRWLDMAQASMRSSGTLDIDSGTCEWLLYLESFRGEIESARALAGWATPIYEGSDKPPALLRWKLHLCHYHAASNDPDQGILTAEEGLQLAGQCGIRRHDAAFMAHRAYFYLVKGDFAAARQGLRQLARSVRQQSLAEAAWYTYLTALEAYGAKDYARAAEIGPMAVASARSYGVAWLAAAALFLQGRIHRSCGQAAPAAACMDEVTRMAGASRSRALRTWALMDGADHGVAGQGTVRLDALSRAFEESARRGTFYHPALGRETMARLCAAALDHDIEPDVALGLIDSLKLSPPDSPGCRRWPWAVRIYIMGRFSIVCGREPVNFPRKAQKRPLELLALLACCGRDGETRERLADQLWPEAEGDKAEQTLSTTLHRLRKLLGFDRSVVQENERIALSSRDCWVDAWHFEDLVRLAAKAEDRGRRIALLAEAVDLYRGEPMGDGSSIRTYSRELLEKTLDALRQLGDLHEQVGEVEQALACWRRGVLLAPTAEVFYQRLMRTLIRQGNRTEAAAVYARCRDTLEHELGLSPSEDTRDLYRGLAGPAESGTPTGAGLEPRGYRPL